MPLPLLPGLAADADVPDDDGSSDPVNPATSLSDLLDSLDDSTMQELNSQAEAYAVANPDGTEPVPDAEEDPGSVPAEDDTSDTEPAPPPDAEDDPDADPDADVDPDAEPTKDEQVSGDDLQHVSDQAAQDSDDADTAVQAMTEQAGGDSDNAPLIGTLVKQAGKIQQQIAKSQKLLDRAIAKEDVQAAAQAGMDVRDRLESIQALQQAANALANASVAPAMTATDHPSMKAWAARVTGKAAKPLPV